MEYRLPVAKHLTDHEYKLFLVTYAAHNKSMGLDDQVKYRIENIEKIERGDNCLEVHFNNGDWWHYTLGGTWY